MIRFSDCPITAEKGIGEPGANPPTGQTANKYRFASWFLVLELVPDSFP